MKRTYKRLLSLVLMLMLVLSMAVPAFADDNGLYANETCTVYLINKSTSYAQTVSVPLANWYGSTKYSVAKSSVKVTAGSAGAKLSSLNSYNRETDYYNANEGKWESRNWYNGNASVSITVEKTGSAKVAYKVGGASHTVKVTVKAYTNPIKSIIMTGVNNGKNFASKTKNSAFASTEVVPTTTSSSKLTVKPADGWKIQFVSIEDENNGTFREIGNWNNGLTSATLNWGKLNASHRYVIDVQLINVNNGATMYCSYGVARAS